MLNSICHIRSPYVFLRNQRALAARCTAMASPRPANNTTAPLSSTSLHNYSSIPMGETAEAFERDIRQRGAGYIGGQWIDALKKFAVHDPGTGEVLGQVSCMDPTHVNLAVEAAHAAFAEWSATSAKHRHGLLMEWFRLVISHANTLAKLLSMENGKPLRDAANEISYAASFIEWFAEEARRQYGEIIPSPHSNAHRIEVLRQPVGVCALITPWNFPAAMVTRKAAAALAAGCTAIVKPAEDTPYTALALARLATIAGIPGGVLNVLPCDRETVAEVGKALATHPMVQKISLTGSTDVGKLIMKLAADTIKRISMELGGNAPFIVFPDCDIDRAVESSIVCKYRHSGQTCVCANRLYIHADVWDAFTTRLVDKAKALKVGHWSDNSANIGPLINLRSLQKVDEITSDARQHGARVLTGGHVCTSLEGSAKVGWFYQPTVIDCRGLDTTTTTTSVARIVKEEIFGPVAALYTFQDEADVIRRANASTSGLAAYIFSQNIDRVHRVTLQLNSGMVGVNTGTFSCAEIPFGGVKESGVGREGSKYGLDEYTYLKAIAVAPC